MNAKKEIHIPLFTDSDEPDDYEVFLYGDANKESNAENVELRKESFREAMSRYLNEAAIGNNQLAQLMGVSNALISYYLSDQRNITYDHLCALCIALRLHPKKQRYLFRLLHLYLPDNAGYDEDERDTIIRNYLDSCAYLKGYTVKACNKKLSAHKLKPLTIKRGKRV